MTRHPRSLRFRGARRRLGSRAQPAARDRERYRQRSRRQAGLVVTRLIAQASRHRAGEGSRRDRVAARDRTADNGDMVFLEAALVIGMVWVLVYGTIRLLTPSQTRRTPVSAGGRWRAVHYDARRPPAGLAGRRPRPRRARHRDGPRRRPRVRRQVPRRDEHRPGTPGDVRGGGARRVTPASPGTPGQVDAPLSRGRSRRGCR